VHPGGVHAAARLAQQLQQRRQLCQGAGRQLLQRRGVQRLQPRVARHLALLLHLLDLRRDLLRRGARGASGGWGAPSIAIADGSALGSRPGARLRRTLALNWIAEAAR
jgi:hypothetical protein